MDRIMFVNDIYNLSINKDEGKEKDIILNVEMANGEIFNTKMSKEYTIIDGIWFTEVSKRVEFPTTNLEFVEEMEFECRRDNSWGSIYSAPMEELGNCELKFVKSIYDLDENNYNQFSIIEVFDNENDITIKLKEIVQDEKDKFLSRSEIRSKVTEIGKNIDTKMFWKYYLLQLIDNLLEQGKDEYNIKITENNIDEVVNKIMSVDELWDTVDDIMSNLIEKYETKFLGENL